MYYNYGYLLPYRPPIFGGSCTGTVSPGAFYLNMTITAGVPDYCVGCRLMFL